MSGSSEDKETVRRLFDAFDAVDADTIRELLSPDFVAHSMPPGLTKDREGFLELARQWRAGFSHEDATLSELLAAEKQSCGPLHQPCHPHWGCLRRPRQQPHD